jgi:hypothetical protein
MKHNIYYETLSLGLFSCLVFFRGFSQALLSGTPGGPFLLYSSNKRRISMSSIKTTSAFTIIRNLDRPSIQERDM